MHVATETIDRAVLDSFSKHVALLDERGCIVAVNDAWRRFAEDNQATLGDEAGWGVGADYLAACRSADGTPNQASARAALEGVRAVIEGHSDEFILEYPCDSPDEARWFRMRVAPVAGPGPARVMVTHEDVTALHHTETALRQSEDLHRQLVESISEAVLMSDAEGRLTYASPRVEAVLGLPPAAVLARGTVDAVLGEGLIDPAMLAALGELRNLECGVVDASGQQRWLLVSVRAVEIGTSRRLYTCRDVGDRRQAEAALAASNRALQTILDASPAGIVTLDPDGLVVTWNLAAERILGWTADEVVGRRYPAVEPGDEASRETALEDAAAGPRLREVRRRRKDGSSVDLLRSVAALTTPTGEAAGIVGVFLDLSEQRAAERALAHTEDLLRRLASHAEDTLYRVRLHPQPALEYISAGCRALAGHTEQDLLANPEPWLSMPDEAGERPLLRLCEAPETAPQTFTLRVTRADGSAAWVEHRASLIRDTSGAVVGVDGIARDITERRTAEENLRRLATALEAAEEGLALLDHQGLVQYANHAFARMRDCEPQHLLGWALDPLPSESDPTHDEGVSALRRREAWSGVLERRRADGSRRHVRRTLTPLPGGEGEAGSCVVLERDISEEMHLQQLLSRSQKLEAIGQLAGGVAHDFNNILSVVLSYGELVGRELDESSPLREDIHEILKAADRGADLVRQLLAFSRADTASPQVVSLAELVAKLEKMLRRVIRENVTLSIDVHDSLPPLLADPSQVDQVLLNLVVNARDAMPEGGWLRIEATERQVMPGSLEAQAGLEPGSYVMLSVIDNGCGMPDDVAARIFEPFYTTKAPGQGTGLGLATAYGILRNAGGDIHVYTAPGEGARFDVYWPTAAAAGRSAPQAEADRLEQGAGERILLVEDEEALRRVMRRILTSAGYEVMEASNGAEALLVAGGCDHRVDLLLTDVVMPLMSGPEAAERLRRTTRALRVLYVSGYPADAPVFGERPADDLPLLRKPFTQGELLNTVRQVLDHAARRNGHDD